MKYKCKVPGCNFETDNRHSIGGHMKGHKKREELAGVPKEVVLKPEDIADALLKRVVEVLTKYDDLVSEVGELRGYKKEFLKVEHELKEAKLEIDRVLKIHNEQVRSRELTDAKTLRKLANL